MGLWLCRGDSNLGKSDGKAPSIQDENPSDELFLVGFEGMFIVFSGRKSPQRSSWRLSAGGSKRRHLEIHRQ